MQEMANEDENFLSSIILFYRWMYISTFTLNNDPNNQNTGYLSQENPRINLTTRTQYPQKINVWAGIFNNQIITVGNLNSQTYLDILINEVGPQLKKLQMKIKRFWCKCPNPFKPSHFQIAGLVAGRPDFSILHHVTSFRESILKTKCTIHHTQIL
jgi:hypothetical protein